MRKTNSECVHLIRLLRRQSREHKAKIWQDVAERLASSRKNFVVVNVSRLNRFTEKNETVLVPGKVLGTGRIDHPITVAAFSFSQAAEQKIRDARGKTMFLPKLMKENPAGSNLKILG